MAAVPAPLIGPPGVGQFVLANHVQGWATNQVYMFGGNDNLIPIDFVVRFNYSSGGMFELDPNDNAVFICRSKGVYNILLNMIFSAEGIIADPISRQITTTVQIQNRVTGVARKSFVSYTQVTSSDFLTKYTQIIDVNTSIDNTEVVRVYVSTQNLTGGNVQLDYAAPMPGTINNPCISFSLIRYLQPEFAPAA